jgi:hypothetical protein
MLAKNEVKMSDPNSKVIVFEALPTPCVHPDKKLLGTYCVNITGCPYLSHCQTLAMRKK